MKKTLIVTLLVTISLVCIGFTKNRSILRDIKLFTTILTIIQDNYVEEKDHQELIYGAIDGMVGALDPHSQFMKPTAYTDLKIHTTGSFGGLGIVITVQEGVLTVVSPIEDTPAWRVGLISGDRIVRIDGESTRGITTQGAVKLLRGEIGTKVHISVFRKGEPQLLEFDIVRGKIPIKTVKYKMLESDIGYIRLTEFKQNSAKEVEVALDALEAQGMKALVLDLRHNPGGLLNVSFDIANKFISAGKMIVYTKGRIKSQDKQFLANKQPTHPHFPLAVLINNGSASASEIVAGAIKDHKRGILVGEKTFGKGSVQSIISLSDQHGIRLTTAKYYTPSGVCIHGVGIVPDLRVPLPYKDMLKLMRQARDEESRDLDRKQHSELEQNGDGGFERGEAIDSTNVAADIEKLQQKLTKSDEKSAEPEVEKIADQQLVAAINALKLKLFVGASAPQN